MNNPLHLDACITLLLKLGDDPMSGVLLSPPATELAISNDQVFGSFDTFEALLMTVLQEQIIL
jgi:hypothetical protein